jgi:hypothetical protein
MGALIRHPIFGKEFVVIAYNGEGVYAYSPRGLDREIPDHEGEMCWGDESASPYLVDCPVKHFKSLGIGDILQYFKKYSVKDRTTHIVIIAGQMVGRGLNIVSNDYKWHLTHQILRVSETSTCADITQSCRVFGIYSDNIPTTLYCLQKDAMNLKQSHELQKRIFEGADLSQVTENMPELCKQIKMFVGHIPRRRTTKKCAEPEWNCVAKEREQYGEDREMVEEKIENIQDDEEWGLKHMIQNLRARLNEGRETVIIRLLKFMVKQNTPQSGTDIQDKCGITALCNFTRWNKKHSSYQVLIKSGHMWTINPVVVEALKKTSIYDKIIE